MSDVLTLQVAARTDEATGVIGLTLSDPQGTRLPEWAPGAHIDLVLEQPGQPSLVRQYSLCGDPADRSSYRVAVLLESEGGGGSRYVHEQVRVGQLVRVSVPRNHFGFEPRDRMVFVAGGIGITPILPMLRVAEQRGADWQLHYAGREQGTMAFASSLAAYGDRVRVYAGAAGERMDLPSVCGAVHGATVYACGPTRLLEALEEHADRAGVDLVVERFTNENEVSIETDHPFEVELSETGITVTVEPGESILDRVSAAGVPTPSSCRSGTCGTCETFVLAGEPDHRDAVLNAREREENEVMMICVSRCKGTKLTLEL